MALFFYLLATVNAVPAEDRSAAGGHPDPSQRVAVHLILLNHPLALLMLKAHTYTQLNAQTIFFHESVA